MLDRKNGRTLEYTEGFTGIPHLKRLPCGQTLSNHGLDVRVSAQAFQRPYEVDGSNVLGGVRRT